MRGIINSWLASHLTYNVLTNRGYADVTGKGFNAATGGGAPVQRILSGGNVGYYTDGNDDYISITHGSNLNCGKITIGLWWRYPLTIPGVSTGYALVDKWCKNGEGQRSYELIMVSDGGNPYTLVLDVASVASNTDHMTSHNHTILGDRPLFCVATFDGTTIKTFVNGQLHATGSFSGTLANNTVNVRFGAQQVCSGSIVGYSPGTFWDCWQVNHALADLEIKELYNWMKNEASARRYLFPLPSAQRFVPAGFLLQPMEAF